MKVYGKKVFVVLMILAIFGFYSCAREIVNPSICGKEDPSVITAVAKKMNLDPEIFLDTFITLNELAFKAAPKGSVDVAYGVYDNLWNSLHTNKELTYYEFIHQVLLNIKYLKQYVDTPEAKAGFVVGEIALGLLNYNMEIYPCDYLQLEFALNEYHKMLQENFPRDEG